MSAAPTITTEQLFMSPAAFGITTASSVQRAACRILDGLPLDELAEDVDVIASVGGPEAVEALPNQRGLQPHLVVLLAAIRSGKSIISAASAIRATQSVDVSRLGPGEIPRVSVLSLSLDTSRVVYSLIRETVLASAVLRPLAVGEPTADSLMLRHPTGRPIEIKCIAGARAGGTLVARWSAGLIADEAPRMMGADDGVVNLDHALDAVQGRLLPGAQIILPGSPWAPWGPTYDLTQEHFSQPSEHAVVVRARGPQMNPVHWTPERCAELEARNPRAFRTDVECEFAEPETGLFSGAALTRCTRERFPELSPAEGHAYRAAMDPSGGGAGANAWTFIIATHERELADDGQPRVRHIVALAREWRGKRPDAVLADIAKICRRYGIASVSTDQFAASALQDLAGRYGIKLDVVTMTAGRKLDSYDNLTTLVSTDCIELPDHAQLRRDLLSVKRRTTQSGATIVLPKTGDGRHCDFAPALALCVGATATDPDRQRREWLSYQRRLESVARGFFPGDYGDIGAAAAIAHIEATTQPVIV